MLVFADDSDVVIHSAHITGLYDPLARIFKRAGVFVYDVHKAAAVFIFKFRIQIQIARHGPCGSIQGVFLAFCLAVIALAIIILIIYFHRKKDQQS